MVKADKYIANLIAKDAYRTRALIDLKDVLGSDYWIAGGFIRNLVWDVLSGTKRPTPINDIDVVYHRMPQIGDTLTHMEEDDLFFTDVLTSARPGFRWEVCNQARMHAWHGLPPYGSLEAACGLWADKESCVMAQLGDDGGIRVYAPYGMFGLMVSPNPTLAHRPDIYRKRIASKRESWVKCWPQLVVTEPQ